MVRAHEVLVPLLLLLPAACASPALSLGGCALSPEQAGPPRKVRFVDEWLIGASLSL